MFNRLKEIFKVEDRTLKCHHCGYVGSQTHDFFHAAGRHEDRLYKVPRNGDSVGPFKVLYACPECCKVFIEK